MIHAGTREEIESRGKTFIRKWRLKHRDVEESLEEAGGGLCSYTVCQGTNGAMPAPRTRSNGCSKSSSAESKRNRRHVALGAPFFRPDQRAKVHGWQTLAMKPLDEHWITRCQSVQHAHVATRVKEVSQYRAIWLLVSRFCVASIMRQDNR